MERLNPKPPTFVERLVHEQELHSIEMARRGIDLSPAAWVIPDTGEFGEETMDSPTIVRDRVVDTG